MNSGMAALLEFYPLTLTVLLECIGILCQFSKPNWFLETCEFPRTVPDIMQHYGATSGNSHQCIHVLGNVIISEEEIKL